MTLEQFRQCTDLFADAALLVARDGRIIAANGRAYEGLGLDPDALQGRRLAEVALNPEEEIEAYLRLCSRVREPVAGTISLRDPRGSAVDCSCRGMLACHESEGQETTLLLNLQPKASSIRRYTLLEEKIDQLNKQVRRRLELEAELRRRNEYLHVTLTSIGDGVIVTDASARVTLLNEVAEKLTGWTAEEAAGVPVEEVFRIVNESSRILVENPVKLALRDRAIVGLANHTVLLAKDGAERPIDDSAAPIVDGGGAVLGAVLVFRDVSEKKKVQKRLRDQMQLFAQLADAIPQLAWTAQPDGQIEWFNNGWYEYTGTTFQEMAGWNWQSVHDPEILPMVLERWRASLATGEPFSMVFPLRGADGKYRPFLTRVTPFRDESGQIKRWFGTNTDISDQKQLEDELRLVAAKLSESNRRKDEFLAMLAHELRNPLAPIVTGLEVLRKLGGDPVLREETRGMLVRQTKQLVALVDDLLDISRISRGKLELRKQRVELGKVLESAIEASQPFLADGNHRFDASLPDHPVELDADPHRLTQVFANLLNNAAKYTPPGGQITLNVETEYSEAVVSIADNGAGIPPEKHETIFEMFAQIEDPYERSHSGLGLGLTLVKTLVEKHRGSVEVCSDGRGSGSVFRVRLPIAAERAGPLESVAVDETYEDGRRRVLIVDDNEAAVKMLCLLVEYSGHEVEKAYNGEDALAVAAQFRPDIVIMDIGMPKLNGYEAARRMRAAEWGKDLTMVALTGWGQERDRQRTREAGFDHHLVKPVDPDQLKRLLGRGLDELP